MCFLTKNFQGHVSSCFKHVVENFLLSKNTKTEEKSKTQNTFIFIFRKNIRDKLIRRKNSFKKREIKFYLKKKRKYFLALIQDSELFSSSNKTGLKLPQVK